MLVRDILLYALAINWVLGGIVMAFEAPLTNDYKILWITFVFGLYGYVLYKMN